MLGIHRNTLRYKLRALGLQKKFSDIPDSILDKILRCFKKKRPESGIRYAQGFLRSHKLRILRECVCNGLSRVDGLGQALRKHNLIMRRKYTSQRSGAVVHLDGMHKLINWGFVVHGITDGHDHMVFMIYSLFLNLSYSIPLDFGVTNKYR